MKYKIFYLFIFISISLFGQDKFYLFTYNFQYKKDSIDNKLSNDIMLLYLNESESLFIPENLYKTDSIINSGSVNLNNFSSLPKSFYKFHIKRNSSNMFYYDKIYTTNVFYEEIEFPSWKLMNETKEIGEFTAKKAEAYYGGRNWIAWYTESIPVSEGPYKFSGLPGLIISLYDEQNNFKFDLISINKNRKVFKMNDDEYIKVNKKDFIKIRREFLEDPIFFMNKDDTKIELSKESMDRIVNNVNKNNNFIEVEKR